MGALDFLSDPPPVNFAMLNFRITKYDPKNRNSDGHYKVDEWTCPSEVGKTFNGIEFKVSEYFEIEEKYINAVIECLQSKHIKHLRVVDLESRFLQDNLSDKDNQWLVIDEFKSIKVFEDKRLEIDNLKIVIKMILRGFLWCRLEINEQFSLRFGWDYYMYICCFDLNESTIKKISETGLFVELLEPIYDMKRCDFYIQTCRTDEDGDSLIEEETLLKTMTRVKIKQGLRLSSEHTGNHSFEITPQNYAMFKNDFEFNFTEYEYFLYCDKVYI